MLRWLLSHTFCLIGWHNPSHLSMCGCGLDMVESKCLWCGWYFEGSKITNDPEVQRRVDEKIQKEHQGE
jgi:hypothetical protein